RIEHALSGGNTRVTHEPRSRWRRERLERHEIRPSLLLHLFELGKRLHREPPSCAGIHCQRQAVADRRLTALPWRAGWRWCVQVWKGVEPVPPDGIEALPPAVAEQVLDVFVVFRADVLQ